MSFSASGALFRSGSRNQIARARRVAELMRWRFAPPKVPGLTGEPFVLTLQHARHYFRGAPHSELFFEAKLDKILWVPEGIPVCSVAFAALPKEAALQFVLVDDFRFRSGYLRCSAGMFARALCGGNQAIGQRLRTTRCGALALTDPQVRFSAAHGCLIPYSSLSVV